MVVLIIHRVPLLPLRTSFAGPRVLGLATRVRINARHVGALKPGEVVWDTAVTGLGARRQAGPVSYVLRYRTQQGRQRTYTIGRHGSPWTPEMARAEALRLLSKIVQGGDPSADKQARRGAIAVADLCENYLADAASGRLLTRRRVPKASSTISTDRSRVEAHIKPLLGHLPVAAVTRDDVERAMHAISEGKTRRRVKLNKRYALSNVRGGRGAASRTIALFGAIMTYAIKQGLRTDNPVHGVMRPADGRRERRLRDEEYAALGIGLHAAKDADDWAPALAAIRFLTIAGWRRGEALTLRWSEVDLARRTAHLASTKTGSSTRALSERTCTILRTMPRGEFVFQAPGGDTPMTGFARVWRRVVHRLGGLPKDVTPHVLRHSFASLAADLGHADETIAALLGHKGHSITRRYIHSADAVLLAAADVVANKATTLMAGDQQEVLAANFQPLQAGVKVAQRDDPSADVDNNLKVGSQVTATAA